AVFADPIFDAQDPRVRRAKSASARAATSSDRRELSLGRLPFSRGEAMAIASLAPARVDLFLGARATRERVLRDALSSYRFIHFATHGIIAEQVPSMSSLVLSRVNHRGRKRDGLVMLPD